MARVLTPQGGGFPPLVPGRDHQGRAGRQRPGARHDGDPTGRATRSGSAWSTEHGRPDQGGRRAERVLPAVHPGELPVAGRPQHVEGFTPGARGGHPRRRQAARRADRRTADVSETVIGEFMAKWISSYRDLPLLLNQWANVRALGDAAADLPAYQRVPLAGGPHRARRLRRRARLRPPDPARGVRGLHGQRARDAGRAGPQDGARAVRRRHQHVHARGA